ncbi:MAG TPA: DUF429 domain-containing protein [Nitrolancea sp.]|nr:DUF429 domain-containing protein [Nitrolancea sp.]
MQVVGVDGCPGGWIAIAYDSEGSSITARVHPTFRDLLAAYPEAVSIGIDIPIGLVEGEPRRCDIEARQVLGPRRSSVFPAPDRRVLHSSTYRDALERSRALTGKGISRQAFGIYPKVAEVDREMTPELQQRVFEVHPEVSFWALAGKPMAFRKSLVEGFTERRTHLQAAFAGLTIPGREEARRLARPASADDVLDAIVVAWTARRHATGRSCRLPSEAMIASRGLRMEIVY